MAGLAESVLQALKDRGAGEVFGIPGDFALPFFKIIESSDILPLYTLSHEPGIGFAADGAARFTSGLSVACVTYGAGALNMINPVAQAYAEKTPMVIISGAPGKAEGQRGLLLHHQVKRLDSQWQIFKELTCDQARLDDPATAAQDIARVLDRCLHDSRPVYLEIPRDMVLTEIGEVPVFTPAQGNPEAAQSAAREVLMRLAAADNPVLMVGVEAKRYGLEAQVTTLAQKLRIPVTTSFMSRGLLAGQDVPLVGTYLGAAGKPEVSDLVEGSDCLLMLGVIVSDTNFGVSGGKIDMRNAIHAFDGQVRVGLHFYPDVLLEDFLDALIAEAKPLGQAEHRADSSSLGPLQVDGEPIHPMDIARGINELFARHGVMPMTSDMGDCLFTAMDIDNTELAAPGYYASMGFGVPGGLGVQAATGRRPLILVGDGAFQMTGWEIGNCRKYGWNPIVVLFNNTSWEMLRVFQPGPAYHDLPDWHYAALADGLGGRGHRASTRAELAAALEAAFADDSQFQLVEVMLPRGAISDTLHRFVTVIRELSSLAQDG
ncbi:MULTISPECIES: indolepyruvate/phenylpyruvate decarboxylase [unclassified Hwanghaeella]|jgi:indolepyruvate decarboxylase|uniref:indolepyruvate/phenylpyruvate decarboxylase n=1 Tax=unclassified Hwanghaeella TaxID=2605944 RepID=UPI000C95F664|nr:indolepyruvate/phenylpyruvate decarboxylase [Rhodospirillales bacterium]|tara:strand:+ start:309 stop:1943 length:1635 start_codon:yes stop_codon:yes gene_type:complete